MPVISISNLDVSYGKEKVLSDVNITIEAGDYVALVGPNGAGKSTLLKTLLGLVRQDRGSVKILGTDRNKFRNWGRIGYLPQKQSFYNPLFPATVSEAVGTGLLSSKKWPKRIVSSDREKIYATLNILDMFELRDRPINHLSGGQFQRAMLARAIVSDPDILLLDEPVTALDPAVREKFFDLLKDLNVIKKMTIVIVTHDTGSVGQYAKKLLYIDKKVIFFGSFKDFCVSEDMNSYFGNFSHHIICHQHG